MNERGRAFWGTENLNCALTIFLFLFTLGVTAGDSLDSEGKSRFHCFNPIKHLKGQYPKWYFSHDANKAKSVMN